MASTYASFLRSPSAQSLAADASISYITTTTSIVEPAAILKHLAANAKQVQKLEEKVLSSIESQDGLCLETQTTLKFGNGGGVYLPGIDENLLDEKTVTFPVTHIVRFTSDGKIQQIRLYWDQGTLLKQVEAIGRTGRNWPIRDGKAQIDAIASSVRSAPSQASTQRALPSHKKHESITATRDPHASLNLFAPRDPDQDAAPGAYQSVLSPRESAKPAPRDYGELFASEETVPKPAGGVRSSSPSKGGANAGQKFVRNRLHDENAPPDVLSPGGAKKVYEQKYNHFAFGDGEDAPKDLPADRRHQKHHSTFTFEDFATPAKHDQKLRPDQQRHWGVDADQQSPIKKPGGAPRPSEERHWGGEDDPPSPPRRNLVHAPRPDAKSHFEITDDVPDDAVDPGTSMTKVDNSRRNDDFGAHYTISDDSPAHAKPSRKNGAGARADQEAHWGFSTPVTEKKVYKTAGDGMGGRSLNLFEDSPATAEKKIYKTAGDGMGGRNNTRERQWWDYENEDKDEVPAKPTRGRGGRHQANDGGDF